MFLLRYIYTILFLAMPWVLLRLLWRSRRNPEYRRRWTERFGFAHQLENVFGCTVYRGR